ncbi:MAG TPA: ATP-binding protein [Tepidisphaeraceae bacterium]|jgi:signal transduction histidine kinase
MDAFGWGFASGLLVTAAGATAFAVVGYQRMLRLQQRARQAERLAELGTLTGGLAHEIKNPLSTVQLNLQLLAEDLLPDNPAYQRVINRLNTVQRETTRLREILDDFLRFAGKIELERKPVDLNEVLEDLVDFFAPQAQLHKVQLRLRKSPEKVIAPVDARLIKQAVLNLMLNAMQAMSGRGEGELILSAAQRDGEAVIDVIDTGPGISQEAIDKIFDAYYSTKKGGTGLGLAMSRRIVDEHGGRIAVSSEPGKGSDFAIHLPL